MLVTILLACGAMFVNDVLATLLTLAESVRKHKIAGHLDGMGDYTRMVLYAGAGTNLLHGHGAWGLIGMLPVAATGDVTTRFSTKHGDRIMEKFAEGGLKGLLTWGLGFLSRKGLRVVGHSASPVVEKPKD